MAGGRIAAIVALCAVSLAATAFAGSASPPLYTVAATEACLEGLPNAITGMPPATAPSPAAPFVYRFRSDRSGPRGQLGAWYGKGGTSAYSGVILSFFKTIPAARTHLKSLYAGSRIRNVVLEWDRPSVAGKGWPQAARSCLRTTPPAGGTPAPTRPTPQASLATFAGYWGGHTRGLEITSDGGGVESANSGCCFRVYRVSFQILSVSGTLTGATAIYRITSFKRFDRTFPMLQTGQVGKLRLKNGIVTNTLTKVFFCSEPAWGATGACGA